MSDARFDIAFYGIIQPGKDKKMVIANMARLFKVPPDKVTPYFAGGRKVIKSNVDELTAEKYRAALENVGLVIKIEAREEAAATETQVSAATSVPDTGGLTVAAVGADVNPNPEEPEPQPIGDISDITLAEPGADVNPNPDEPVPQPIGDISDITLAEPGADVNPNPEEPVPQPIGDISDITLAEPGANVNPNPEPEKQTPIPDTSDIELEEEK